MSELPSPAATPAAIVDALKAIAGNPPKVRASFARGRCVRGTYPVRPSGRDHEIAELHKTIARAGALLVGRRQSRVIDADNFVLRGFSFRLGDDDSSLRHPHAKRSGSLCEDARADAGVLAARIPGPDGSLTREGPRRSPPPILKRCIRQVTWPPIRFPQALPIPPTGPSTPFPQRIGVTRHSSSSSRSPGGATQAAPTEEAKTKSADFLHDDLGKPDRSRDIRFNVMAVLGRPGDPKWT